MHKLTYGRSPELEFITMEDCKDASQRAARYHRQFQDYMEKHTEDDIRYDAIFIDEGQDFAPEEFQLLLGLLKPDKKTDEKNLIIFYDDAQNLYARQRPDWRQIGIDVQRGDRAKVMK